MKRPVEKRSTLTFAQALEELNKTRGDRWIHKNTMVYEQRK